MFFMEVNSVSPESVSYLSGNSVVASRVFGGNGLLYHGCPESSSKLHSRSVVFAKLNITFRAL
jgi:hypothetical protein